MVSKNCTDFVLNCAAVFKFCAFIVLQNAGGSRDASPPIANLDFIMVSKNCAHFVPKYAVIFKFRAACIPEISHKEILGARTNTIREQELIMQKGI